MAASRNNPRLILMPGVSLVRAFSVPMEGKGHQRRLPFRIGVETYRASERR